MATVSGKQNVQRHSQVWFFLFLTICFTLCGAGACQPLDMNGGGDAKKWDKMLEAGNTSMKAGDYAAAEDSFVKAEKLCAKEFGKDDARRATCLGYLAEMYRAQQEYRKAALVYKELIEIHEKIDPKSSELANFRSQYAEIQRKIKDYGLDKDPNAPQKPAAKPGDKDGKKPAAKKK
ncbi:MAG: tetratricopeptide repeat protein [Cyanobacteria bacterium SZAS-4]|nr:tetratricopeptide repeat protein [Cyanobacteria bacterium SZAS-4]